MILNLWISRFLSRKNFFLLEFDRYIVQDKDLALTEFRLLETDNRPVLPFSIESQVLISRADVLHSWTISRLGLRADTNPGWINNVKLRPHNSGVFYGQYSKICGDYHRFIPISLEFVLVKSKFSCYLLDDSGYEREILQVMRKILI